MALYVQETYVDATEDCMIGESEVYETGYDESGPLFRAMRDEYGRCIGRVYVDTADRTKAIGWIFEGRDKYQDSSETYLRHVWVTLHDGPDTVTRERHYHELTV